MNNMSMPLGEYDKAIESSEALALYEGSKFLRYIKDKLAGFKYGTKSNPKTKGNVISYIDSMGRLITQEQGKRDNKDNIEYTVRKISTSAKTEAIISIEVIEKKRDKNGNITMQTRMFYPSEADYKENDSLPKIKEITYFKDNKSYLRKTIERCLNEEEMNKRFDAGTIKLNSFAPDNVKNEILGSKIIYTVDKLETKSNLSDTLKPFGTHLQINEMERTYVVADDFNPETEEIKSYVGPTEAEKDVILYSNQEPKARIEESEKITFSLGKIHNICSSIANYPDQDGNYGTNGRGTCAIYDNKILHATGNKAVILYQNNNGGFASKIDGEEKNIGKGFSKIGSAEIRGSIISLTLLPNQKNKAEDIAKSAVSYYKDSWNVNIKTIVEYKEKNSSEVKKLSTKEILDSKKVEVKPTSIQKTENVSKKKKRKK